MHTIASSSMKESLCPITSLTFLGKEQQRVACRMILDKCYTNNRLISWKLTTALDLPSLNGTPRTFVTAAGTFTTDKTVKLIEAMLPCLLTSHTFTLEVLIIPKECSSKMSNGMIIGEESKQMLDIDTSVCHNTISWGETHISMVPHDYYPAATKISEQTTFKICNAVKALILIKLSATAKDCIHLKVTPPVNLPVALRQNNILLETKQIEQKIWSTLFKAINEVQVKLSTTTKTLLDLQEATATICIIH
jgi:hypothetical protein